MRSNIGVTVFAVGMSLSACAVESNSGPAPVPGELEGVPTSTLESIDSVATTFSPEAAEDTAPTTTLLFVEIDCDNLSTKTVGCEEEIEVLQTNLNDYECNAGDVDGLFGEETKKAVINFQKANGLFVDALAGSETNDEFGLEDTLPCSPDSEPEPTTTVLGAPEITVPEATVVPIEVVVGSGVEAQQTKLNSLLNGFGMPELTVDGKSGPNTDQALCASRLLLGLEVTRADMIPGSEEEQILLTSPAIKIPKTANTEANNWILIDKTCQVLVAGNDKDSVKFVMPTSTGQQGFETRRNDREGSGGNLAFRYDPALDNIDNPGWHDSSEYPSETALNGNMYKPVYFDGGQAIHGSQNVPTTPGSKGCARTTPAQQDQLITWLGLGDLVEETVDPNVVGATVKVQGEYEYNI